jgi:hypothetical protein
MFVSLAASSHTHASELSKYFEKIKGHITNLLGKEAQNEKVVLPFEIPPIPTLMEAATSTSVYDKTGEIYKQGSSFSNLALSQKRKFRLAFLRELYSVVRGSEGSQSEIIQNLSMLEQGATREGIYRSLVLGRDYNNLETFQQAPSDILVKYTTDYAIKFLGLQYKSEQISQLNLWGIKRVIIEKTLEVIDSFPKDGLNLHRWYAHFSYDLAQGYAEIWKTKTRRSTNILFHKAWAEKVPLQQIKSEVIVKISKTMNYLQEK